MRLLLAIHNAYTDYTSGAAHSMRIIMQWLAEAGHECQVLATARFDGTPPESIDEHLAGLGVPVRTNPPARAFVRSVRKPPNVRVGRPTAAFKLGRVPVTQLNRGDTFIRMENDQYLFLFEQIVREFEPDLLLTYGARPVLQEVMRRARRRGMTTVFSLRNLGYEDRRWFVQADHVLTTSPYLSEHYRLNLGLESTGIESPIDWSEVLAPGDLRKFVTFVNPSPRKGVAVFARLADMLGAARPDIPLLIVQSATRAGGLNTFPGIDFGKYPHIVASPSTRMPADFFALTKILLVPSLAEPFGRVAAEAMINGIPPLVSNRGGLPATVAGSGRVLPIPEWLTDDNPLQLPSADDVRPWFDAVCGLWDDPQGYEEDSNRARQTAERLYSEAVLKRRYLDYFGSLARQMRGPN